MSNNLDKPRSGLPDGWSMTADYMGYRATHRDYGPSYEGDGWVDNGLSAWGSTRESCLAAIEEIEAEHPHFSERRKSFDSQTEALTDAALLALFKLSSHLAESGHGEFRQHVSAALVNLEEQAMQAFRDSLEIDQ